MKSRSKKKALSILLQEIGSHKKMVGSSCLMCWEPGVVLVLFVKGIVKEGYKTTAHIVTCQANYPMIKLGHILLLDIILSQIIETTYIQSACNYFPIHLMRMK